MISMTVYWQCFKDVINQLPQVKTNPEYTRQIQIARNLIRIGLQIETQGITEIKEVANHLHQEAVKFNNKIAFKTEEADYEFHLPKITSRESLIFAIVYYQHLKNYRDVQYEGTIWMLRSFVVKSVEDKKKSTACQALALLDEIKPYCVQNGIPLINEQLDRGDTESPKDYITRLVKLFASVPAPQEKEILPIEPIELKPLSIPPEDTSGLEACKKLEKKLTVFASQRSEIQAKIASFEQKINHFNAASKHYYSCRSRWEQLSWYTQCYYWIKSCFFSVELIESLQDSALHYENAEKALHLEINDDELKQITISQNEELSSARDWERYRHQLQYHLQEVQKNYEQTHERLQKVKLTQQEQKNQALLQQLRDLQEEKQLLKDQYHKLLAQQAMQTPTTQEETADTQQGLSEEASETSTDDDLNELHTSPPPNEPDYYGFFKSYLPSNATISHITVALGAIATQQLMT
ncbi:hypothetical protein DIZ81_10880 [Legionella taurinensis]|uniref:Uncharacterized protein n=3 Tax=Legionella taurinensis TaxID=70611 RepID=A0A3A5LDA8_9GAMM|nr:hypothetical protein [Legionella taurinensis]PUT39115.1 hypothetical protein DB744_10890 [Legionella taurinensis]PUT39569.1 hypothetical protein DB746_13545 [Legionella taurinensis]PUT43571.1 hypothetical protein DB743_10280 [Legionella taurinensis]PUT45225.1 hypothetical protein DB745_13485 [Legionella taurinensis]RJT46912.1 hypothetical protein D6J04_07735 [Legionella taurinensis]